MSGTVMQAPRGYREIVRAGDRGELLESLQWLNSEQWSAWIVDRLHGRDSLLPMDPRQGETPEYLFAAWIPRLSAPAKETAYIAIKDVVERAVSEPWAPWPLARLFYLVECLRITACERPLRRYLDQHYDPEREAVVRPFGPYGRALCALAAMEKERPIAEVAAWKEWIANNPVAYLPLCFTRLSEYDPDRAFQLLEVGDFAESELAKVLLDEIEVVARRSRMAPEWSRFLRELMSKNVALLPRIKEILPDTENEKELKKFVPMVSSMYEIAVEFSKTYSPDVTLPANQANRASNMATH